MADRSRKISNYLLGGLGVLGGIAIIVAIALPIYMRHCCGSAPPEFACMANLKAVAGAKTEWASAYNKMGSDVLTDTDIFGTDKFIREQPVCPLGGTYTLGAVGEKPRCSIPGHTI